MLKKSYSANIMLNGKVIASLVLTDWFWKTAVDAHRTMYTHLENHSIPEVRNAMLVDFRRC